MEYTASPRNHAAVRTPHRGVPLDGGTPMELRSLVATLVQMIWEREQRMHRPMDAGVLGYVRDAVTVELEYRRRMRELDRRIMLLAEPVGAADRE